MFKKLVAASGQLGAVSVRAKFSVAGIGGDATHPAPREACCLFGAGWHPQPALPLLGRTGARPGFRGATSVSQRTHIKRSKNEHAKI